MNLLSARQQRHVGVVAVLVSIGLSDSLSAQQMASPVDIGRYISTERGLTIDQLVATALERSPTVLAAHARVESARGERMQAGLRPNPTVMSDVREQIGGTDRQTMVGLNWPLDLFRRPGRIAVTDQRIVLAEQEAAEVERLLAADVRAKALQLLAAVRHFEVRGQIASTLSQFRDLVEARAQSGAAPPLERDMADVDARRAEAEVLRERAAVESTLAELKGLIGLTPDQPLLLRQDLEQLAATDEPAKRPSTDTPVAQLLSARPDIRLAEALLGSASADLALIRREARPEVSVSAGYMRMNSGFPLFGLDTSGTRSPIQNVFHNVSIGATVTLPWRDRRQGDIAAGTAKIQTAKLELDTRRLVAQADIQAARSRVEGVEAALAVYTGGLRTLARKNVDVAQQSYQLGRATLMDVLAETRRFLETENAYTDVLLDTLQARSDLASAIGVIR